MFPVQSRTLINTPSPETNEGRLSNSLLEGLDYRQPPTTFSIRSHFRSVQIIRCSNVRIVKNPLKPVRMNDLWELGLQRLSLLPVKRPPGEME